MLLRKIDGFDQKAPTALHRKRYIGHDWAEKSATTTFVYSYKNPSSILISTNIIYNAICFELVICANKNKTKLPQKKIANFHRWFQFLDCKIEEYSLQSERVWTGLNERQHQNKIRSQMVVMKLEILTSNIGLEVWFGVKSSQSSRPNTPIKARTYVRYGYTCPNKKASKRQNLRLTWHVSLKTGPWLLFFRMFVCVCVFVRTARSRPMVSGFSRLV